ncbi:DNA repair protein [Mergibacter septicus]|uniref:DNA repair protein n=1 Tax=Mergibacter septicus TaxID=221402 RepID=A0A8D4LMA8_9PAST|nr:DNA repair protein [Mergibacter septicus]AWX15547.1 DNA repair protein [Mergibacter septicus]QDJ14801.1 DNA repair protein [Mergibacter septicus]UTU47770.1 DNA repair protein [Mergibacter septicus]WMR96622.1 DNA repair protein [Mergibacter septicus]
MAKKIYLSQIQAKIDRLQRERKQVLEHLALVESKLDKLQAAIEVMQSEALTDEYNTELYTYRTYQHRFKGKLRQMVLAEMKVKPNHYFTVNELTELVLIRDGQELIIQQQHTVSVRGALKHWLNKDVVERIALKANDVRWRLKA